MNDKSMNIVKGCHVSPGWHMASVESYALLPPMFIAKFDKVVVVVVAKEFANGGGRVLVPLKCGGMMKWVVPELLSGLG
ncbi:hypothetical protein RIF29_17293 [Crotalaria pallida]|uniref:Uncharacterized protein n=1 Tax=Crotalaria pallida TaxID=3830 RepID=A0AAN9IF66_CROPI